MMMPAFEKRAQVLFGNQPSSASLSPTSEESILPTFAHPVSQEPLVSNGAATLPARNVLIGAPVTPKSVFTTPSVRTASPTMQSSAADSQPESNGATNGEKDASFRRPKPSFCLGFSIW